MFDGRVVVDGRLVVVDGRAVVVGRFVVVDGRVTGRVPPCEGLDVLVPGRILEPVFGRVVVVFGRVVPVGRLIPEVLGRVVPGRLMVPVELPGRVVVPVPGRKELLVPGRNALPVPGTGAVRADLSHCCCWADFRWGVCRLLRLRIQAADLPNEAGWVCWGNDLRRPSAG